MLGIGVVGGGSISEKHIDAIAGIADAQVVAVSSRSIESAVKAAERCGANVCATNEELLACDDVDAVIICTPSGNHGDIAIAAANAGKHVIVEKPIEITLEKIDEMICACKYHNVQLHGIYNNRYKPVYQFLKKAVDGGRFGKMINANANVRWYRTPEYYQDSSWHGTWSLDGGGTLMNQSIHYVDLLLWLAGDVSSVFGYTRTLLHAGIETEDTAVASLEFANGAIGSIVATTSTFGGFPAELQLTGERGTVVVKDNTIVNWVFRDNDPIDDEIIKYQTEKNAKAYADPAAFSCADHRAQLTQIFDEILKRKTPSVSGEEARKAVELILRIYRSSKEHREF